MRAECPAVVGGPSVPCVLSGEGEQHTYPLGYGLLHGRCQLKAVATDQEKEDYPANFLLKKRVINLREVTDVARDGWSQDHGSVVTPQVCGRTFVAEVDGQAVHGTMKAVR